MPKFSRFRQFELFNPSSRKPSIVICPPTKPIEYFSEYRLFGSVVHLCIQTLKNNLSASPLPQQREGPGEGNRNHKKPEYDHENATSRCHTRGHLVSFGLPTGADITE